MNTIFSKCNGQRRYLNDIGKVIEQIILVILILVSQGCDKDNENTDNTDNTFTQKEEQAVISSYNAIDSYIKDFNTQVQPKEYCTDLLEYCKKLPMVEEAYYEDLSLVVKFKEGGYVFWEWVPQGCEDMNGDLNSIMKALKSSGSDSSIPTNNTVCLINANYDESASEISKELILEIEEDFRDFNFNVDIKNGSEASISFFESKLSDYGILIFFGHGSSNYNPEIVQYQTWIQTGERGDMASMTNKYLQRWKNNEVALHSRVTLSKEVGVISQYRYIMISEGFIDDYYKAKSFPNSLVYLSACQGLKYPTRLPKTLVDKGVGVVIGWTGNNSIGRNTCYSLVSSLLDGKSVGESFEVLPDMEKKDYNTQYFSFPIMQYLLNLMGIGTPPRAELAYYPPEGKDMHLLEGPKYIGVWNYYFDYYEGGWTMAGTIEIKQGGNATIRENLEYPHHVCNGTWSLGKNDLGEESILIEFIGEVYPHTEYPGNWYRYDITYDGCYGYDYQTKTISGRMLYHSFHKYEANPWKDTGISSSSCELRKD